MKTTMKETESRPRVRLDLAGDDPHTEPGHMTAEDHLRAARHHLDAVVQDPDAGYLDQMVPAIKALEELES